MLIRNLRESDLDAVLRINAATSPATVLWTRAMYAEALADASPGKVWVAEEQGCIAGFICFRVVLKEVQVPNFAVDPAWQGQGIGSVLLENVWRSAIAAGAEEMTLEVRQSNAAALRFYKRHGFEQESVRPRLYSAPPEDAICLVRKRLQTGIGQQ